jgi:hypothetical protein
MMHGPINIRLKLVFDLKQEMHTFMEGKGNPFGELKYEK